MSEVRGAPALVRVDAISPNPWNPNRMSQTMFEKELASIRAHGFIVPVTVRQVDGGYQIVDGEHRWKAAKALGIEAIPCWDLGVIEDDDARELTIILNETRGESNPERLRELLRDLSQRRSPEHLGTIMPYSAERLSAMIGERAEAFGGLVDRMRDRSKASETERVYRLQVEHAKMLDAMVKQAIHDGADGQSEALLWIAEAYERHGND